MERERLNRRELLKGAGAAAGALAIGGLGVDRLMAAPRPPSAPVSLARCVTYDQAVVTARLQTMFDQLGGLRKLVRGKTVAVKVNLTGHPRMTAVGRPASRTFQTHPAVVLATALLLDRAGAKRIRFLEGTYQKEPMEALVREAGWDLQALGALKAAVEYEDTRNLGKGKQYHRVKVPGGGSLFPAYDLNHSYVECDAYLSLAKLKNHVTAGVTLAIKNNFGITPTALYGQPRQDEGSTSARVDLFHHGKERPADGIPQEVDPKSPRVTSYRVPRHTVDALGIRPIDLCVIDGIETVSGGEGPWCEGLKYQKADLLIAGRNAVCTDAIATAAMGYDPLAPRATGPFPGDNHLTMARDLGLGACDPKQIEVVGLPLKEALHPFGWEPATRNY